MGLQDTTCPKCSLDLSLAGAVRLTNPALGGNRYNAVPRVPRRDVGGLPGEEPADDNAVTRVIPSMPADPDATMVRPIGSDDPGWAAQGRRADAGSRGSARPSGSAGVGGAGNAGTADPGAQADLEATQVLRSGGPRPSGQPAPSGAPRSSAGAGAPGHPDGGAVGRDDEQWVPTGRRPQAAPAPRRTPQYEDPSLPPAWFRDPEAEHTRAMRSPVPPPQPVFTPPPTPASPTEPPRPGPHSPKPHDRRWVLVIVLVLILTFLVLGIVVWWMLGGSMTRKEAGSAVNGSPSGSSSLLGNPRVSGPTDAGQPSSQEPSRLQSTPASSPSSAASLPDSVTHCTASVGAGGATSCDFAQNVAAAIPAGSNGDAVVRAASPVTGKTYTMTCKAGSVVVCRGGNDAEVYVIR